MKQIFVTTAKVVATLYVIALLGICVTRQAFALSSCSTKRATSIVSFSQGVDSNGATISPSRSNPNILLADSPSDASLALGVGGSVTLRFNPPLANYPAAGLPTLSRPSGTLPCDQDPVKAMIEGSIDGITFTPLGVTCTGNAVNLGALPWVSFIRITDTSEGGQLTISSEGSAGFTLNGFVGPACLKTALCGGPATPEVAIADPAIDETFSLGTLGDDFILFETASFEEYGNGSARFTGTVAQRSDLTRSFQMILSFTGKTPAPPLGSPLLLLKKDAYTSQGGDIDPAQWYYYKTVKGSLIGTQGNTGIVASINDTVQALQIGDAADGRSRSPGALTQFVLQTSSTTSEGGLAFKLRSCAEQPTPTPTPTPTPADAPQGEINNPSGSCSANNKIDQLATLDQDLLLRRELIFKATSALVRSKPGRASRTFQAKSRTTAQNLSVAAWGTIWRYPWSILSCPAATLCISEDLATQKGTMLNAIDALDSHVRTTVNYVLKRVKNKQTKRSLLKLLNSLEALRTRSHNLVGELPAKTFNCPR